ncbi:protein ALP1-like [Frieseomelitta varia]|uniref:protein ALP1-like n=1 Tax=Frieseomelitta varia TaxID=561572 RepID=UPI001CB6ABD1|nr:protein ALP1-like [Frieseomelitta varia]
MKSLTFEDFLRNANDFYIWNFPNTISAIDGKHIRLKCSPNSGTMYYNYKQSFSIVLQAIADVHGKLIIVKIGGYGKQSDDGTFRSSQMFELMKKGNLNIPTNSPLSRTSNPMPFLCPLHFGNEAYPLLLKPYNRKNLDPQTEYFNSCFSRARLIVECAFGIMNAKWRILWKPIETLPAFTDNIVRCICVLHNAIIDLEGNEILEMFNEHKIVREVQ